MGNFSGEIKTIRNSYIEIPETHTHKHTSTHISEIILFFWLISRLDTEKERINELKIGQ